MTCYGCVGGCHRCNGDSPEKSAIFCNHANEVPSGGCPCEADCYCRNHTCKPGRFEEMMKKPEKKPKKKTKKKPDVQPGATGRFPEGKVSEDDEGELAIKLEATPGLVTLRFGKKIAWFALRPDQTRQLAELLLLYADAAGSGSRVVVRRMPTP